MRAGRRGQRDGASGRVDHGERAAGRRPPAGTQSHEPGQEPAAPRARQGRQRAAHWHLRAHAAIAARSLSRPSRATVSSTCVRPSIRPSRVRESRPAASAWKPGSMKSGPP